jgi:hypothetical protein
MYPEVAEYLAVKDKSDQEHLAWEQERQKARPKWDYHAQTHDAYYEAYDAWSAKYNEESRKMNARHNKISREAMRTLHEKTQDPMIKWMMEQLSTVYGRYVDTVLKILPATRDELEVLANREDWCGEFDEFMQQATDAGVIPPRNDPWDVSEILDWIGSEFDVYPRRHHREIQGMVNKIVQKALAEKIMQDATERQGMVTA